MNTALNNSCCRLTWPHSPLNFHATFTSTEPIYIITSKQWGFLGLFFIWLLFTFFIMHFWQSQKLFKSKSGCHWQNRDEESDRSDDTCNTIHWEHRTMWMIPYGRACHRCVKVKDRVELYRYSSSVLSWHVIRWTVTEGAHKTHRTHTKPK